MFWAMIIPPNQLLKQVVKQPFHVSMACLDTSITDYSKVQLMIKYKKKTFLLCTLSKGSVWQMPLDLSFGKNITISFLTNGNGTIHLSGYLLPKDTEIHVEEELQYIQEAKQHPMRNDQRQKRKAKASLNHKKTKHVRICQDDNSSSLSELSETECPVPSPSTDDNEYYEEDVESQHDEVQEDKKKHGNDQKSKKKENLDQHKQKVKDSKEDRLDEEKKEQLKQKVKDSKEDQLDEKKMKLIEDRAKVKNLKHLSLFSTHRQIDVSISGPYISNKDGTLKYYDEDGNEIDKIQYDKLEVPDRYNPDL